MTEDEAVQLIETERTRIAELTAEVSRAAWTLVHECGWSVTRVAGVMGASRPTVYQRLRWVDALDVPGAGDAEQR